MNIEELQAICKKLPHVTEDIKWQHDLCFCIGGKMFCVAGLNQSPTTVSFKVLEDEFEAMSQREGFKPAPYVAKYQWVHTDDLNRMISSEWEHFVKQSYELVKAKLPPKIRKSFDNP